MDDLEALCKAYLDDTLPSEKRKEVEKRIANGDADLINTLNRLKEFPNPTQPSAANPDISDQQSSDLGDFISDKDTESKNEASNKQDSSDDNSDQDNSTLADIPYFGSGGSEENHDKARNRILQVVGVFIIVLVLFFIYYQWENIRLEQENTFLQKQLDQITTNYEQLRKRNRRLERRHEHIASILQGDLFEYVSFSSSSNHLQSAALAWDRSTMRMAFLVHNAKLPSNQALHFWTRNHRNQWSYLGSIDTIKKDSIYTNWDNSAMSRVRLIEVRLDSATARPPRERGSRVTQVQMPE